MPSMRTVVPFKSMMLSFQDCSEGAIAANVAASARLRNSSAVAEKASPKPNVAPRGFCSKIAMSKSGRARFKR